MMNYKKISKNIQTQEIEKQIAKALYNHPEKFMIKTLMCDIVDEISFFEFWFNDNHFEKAIQVHYKHKGLGEETLALKWDRSNYSNLQIA